MTSGLETKRMITDGKKFKKVVDLKADQIQLPTGIMTGKEINDMTPGSSFYVNKKKYFLFECTLADFLDKKLERKTQIMYPKEIGYLIYNLDISPGDVVGEAGTGSGAMTLSLSRTVGTDGKVYTYEERDDFIKNITKNISKGTKFDNINLKNRSIDNGIDERDLDAFIIDLPEPCNVIKQVREALKPSGNLGILVPTYNQVSDVIPVLKENEFFLIEIVELMARRLKHNPNRLRPEDTMIGHTGYLILARKLVSEK
ncbi:tRNA (adenine-N1)-methyltransferase [Natranaerobius trueperi]|uniref:tRNA (adenine(58)-N(1))-methyltransferase TrmI n=1 Tax=Natranaerobius trueperi TaxID=759412 RepID=A0A226BZ23_9FIRM|nr:methyltransferase domain-containing protein [Natranaerobius trueperi]OWZ83574.1 SAM-dependent methyltransferase [Natranaerobius trueperi]